MAEYQTSTCENVNLKPRYRSRIGVTSPRDALGMVDSSHSVPATCICSSSSESPKNKMLHSPGSLEVKRMKDGAEEGGQTLFSLRCIFTSFCSSGCFLPSYTALRPRGVLNPSSPARQMLSFLFISPFTASLCFSVSSPIIASLELP